VRDTWYADKRDLVKWGTLAHLAERHSLAAIVQVAYLRLGTRDPLKEGGREIPTPLPQEVWAFFRDVTAVCSLGHLLQRCSRQVRGRMRSRGTALCCAGNCAGCSAAGQTKTLTN